MTTVENTQPRLKTRYREEIRDALNTAAGATVKEPARQVGWGRIVTTVTDPDGNVLGLLQDR